MKREKFEIPPKAVIPFIGQADMANNDFKKLLGKFIALDGPDGCGKTVQTGLLIQALANQGIPAVSFRDPGDTTIGERIRKLLLSPEHIAMDTSTEVLLYMAARAQLWREKIAPALRANECVILDRWLSSTCAYQGYAGSFGMDKVIKVATHSLNRVWPDLTIILDVDLETGFGRLAGEPDRMEAKTRLYHQNVRVGFLQLAQNYQNFAVVDATGDIQTVHKKIIEIVLSY